MLNVEDVRLPLERRLGKDLRKHRDIQHLIATRPAVDVDEARRDLRANALLLSERMAPRVHQAARDAQAALGLQKPFEIYQSAGQENVATYMFDQPIIFDVFGRHVSEGDGPFLKAIFGHEVGHFLAHGPHSPLQDICEAARTLCAGLGSRGPDSLASGLCMAMELTADRFGLLVCRDLDAILRAVMAYTAGLSPAETTWDTEAYLEDCKELMEATLASGDGAIGFSHPEHNLRAYAAWLWSESDAYQELTGEGPGSRRIVDIDATLSKLLHPGPKAATGPRKSESHGSGRVIVKGDRLESVDTVSDRIGGAASNAKGALGRAGEKLKPGWSKLKKATTKGVAKVLDRKSPIGDDEPEERLEDVPDPLAEDEEALLDRFAALEADQNKATSPSASVDPLAEDEQALLDRFAELEKKLS